MNEEEIKDSSRRILQLLQEKYPGKECYDLDGRGLHFVCEVEPVSEHPEYDTAVEVIIKSKPHKHLKMTQRYRVLTGSMELNVENEVIELKQGDSYVITPGKVHWATSDGKSIVELYSVPGWTKEDHITLDD
jgi:mannose-6-phosphate isomerase-like protein (cupin superfamily)